MCDLLFRAILTKVVSLVPDSVATLTAIPSIPQDTNVLLDSLLLNNLEGLVWTFNFQNGNQQHTGSNRGSQKYTNKQTRTKQNSPASNYSLASGKANFTQNLYTCVWLLYVILALDCLQFPLVGIDCTTSPICWWILMKWVGSISQCICGQTLCSAYCDDEKSFVDAPQAT